MNHRLLAFDLFSARPVETRDDVLPFGGTLRGLDMWPALAVAACELSGGLDDVPFPADDYASAEAVEAANASLDDCVRHFLSLLSAEIVTEESWRQLTIVVADEVARSGQELTVAALGGPASQN